MVVDTWWMTETGGFLGSTLPALQAMKPGSCGMYVALQPGVAPSREVEERVSAAIVREIGKMARPQEAEIKSFGRAE